MWPILKLKINKFAELKTSESGFQEMFCQTQFQNSGPIKLFKLQFFVFCLIAKGYLPLSTYYSSCIEPFITFFRFKSEMAKVAYQKKMSLVSKKIMHFFLT